MKTLLIWPIVVPLLTGILCLFAWNHRRVQRVLVPIGSFASLSAAIGLFATISIHGTQSLQIGNWPAPFGITLVADLLSSIMVLLTGIVGLAVTIYSLVTIDRPRERFGFHPLIQILLMGINGAFLTGDMFNLYVWFEVMLIASFVLLALGGKKKQLEGSLKYVTLNLVSSALFLTAVGLLYGVAGTLNMADLANRLPQANPPELVLAVAMLFLVAFGIKAAVFPLFFWLPASYHTAPVPVSAIFAGLLTKVGVYALIRVFTLLFTQDIDYTHHLLLIIAALTMITGVLGAAAQTEIRRILSFHIVSQIGFMLMGLALYTPLALAGAVFYIIHHIIVKTNLFLISGIAQRITGSSHLKEMGGIYERFPALSLLFLIPALSLAGIPPLSGFWAKLTLIQAGLHSEQYWIVGVALGVGMLTLFSMTKIWMQAFWKPHPSPQAIPLQAIEPLQLRWRTFIPPIGLALITLIIGLAAEPVLAVAQRAAEQLLNPAEYIETVLAGAK